MEPLEGPPVSSPDPAIISSVEQQASSSTHAVSDMLASSPSVMTHTTQETIRFTKLPCTCAMTDVAAVWPWEAIQALIATSYIFRARSTPSLSAEASADVNRDLDRDA